ncbi:MAG: DUF2169 domain-containing protein [Byssovorax sp.]
MRAESRMPPPSAPPRVSHGFLLLEDGARGLHAAVIVKATYALRPSALAEIAPPLTLSDDVYGEGTASRSLVTASDFAPRKAQADVVITGTVHPRSPGIVRQAIGFAIARGPDVLLRKRLVAVGDRARDAAAPAPLRPFPLGWEQTWGGPDNPIGCGLGADARRPALVDPAAPSKPAGLGPIAPAWRGRAKYLGDGHAAFVRAIGSGAAGQSGLPAPAPLALPGDLDLRCFQIAPPDQRLDRLLGGEQLLLAGLLPDHPIAICRLPALHAFARIEAPSRPARSVPLTGDTLWVDVDRGLACVTFRGSIPIASRAESTALLRDRRPWQIHAGLAPCRNAEETAGTPRAWSAPRAVQETARSPQIPTVDPLVVHNASGLTVGSHVWSFSPPKRRRIVIIKATYAIPADGGPLVLAADQDRLRGDEPEGGEPDGEAPEGEILYPSDHAPFKAKTDVILRGTAHAPPSRTTALVRLTLGSLDATLVALGPRTWGANGIPTPPGPFEPLPLRWAHALGGAGHAENPAGTGIAPGSPPPRLEDPEHLLRSRSDRPAPACFGPVSPTWPLRASHLGTFDRAWKRERWPYFPADFDSMFFQAAPAALQRSEPRGGEPFSITSVRPGGGDLSGKLPEARPRAFAVREDGSLFEVLLRLDTVIFDADAERVLLLWRGSFDLDEGGDAASLLVLREEPAAPITLADAAIHVAALAEPRLDPGQAREGSPRPTEAPPPSTFHLATVLAAPLAAAIAVASSAAVARPKPPAPLDRAAVEQLLQRGKDLRGRDLTGADLRGIDLSKRDLTGAILAGVNLTGADLRGAILASANLTGADASDAGLDGADLGKADLTGAILRRASLARASIERATLASAKLEGAHLDEVKAAGADLTSADLSRCQARSADLTKADLSSASLAGAAFHEARLDDARLYEARAAGAIFDGASLVDARFERAILSGCSFHSAAAKGAVWEGADLTDASLRSADLTLAVFSGARLAGADLTGVLARGASFRAADLSRARLDGADLMRASLEGATLRGATLRGASLYQAETRDADLAGADLARATVAGTKLDRG